MKKLTVFIIVFIISFRVCISAFAETEETQLSEDLQIPKDFSFSTSDTCSSHMYFLQATAQEDGTVVVCSHYIDPDGKSEETFKRQYIDIYDSNGQFHKELSFISPHPYAISLVNNTLHISFYAYVVTYNIETGETGCYDKPDGYIVNNQEKNFSSGEWDYYAQKGINGYTKLIRKNSDTTQVIVEMVGKNGTPHIIMIFGSLTLVVIAILLKKKQRSN